MSETPSMPEIHVRESQLPMLDLTALALSKNRVAIETAQRQSSTNSDIKIAVGIVVFTIMAAIGATYSPNPIMDSPQTNPPNPSAKTTPKVPAAKNPPSNPKYPSKANMTASLQK